MFAAGPARDAHALRPGRRCYRCGVAGVRGRAFRERVTHTPESHRSDIAVPSMGESMSEGTSAVVLKQPGARALCGGSALRTL